MVGAAGRALGRVTRGCAAVCTSRVGSYARRAVGGGVRRAGGWVAAPRATGRVAAPMPLQEDVTFLVHLESEDRAQICCTANVASLPSIKYALIVPRVTVFVGGLLQVPSDGARPTRASLLMPPALRVRAVGETASVRSRHSPTGVPGDSCRVVTPALCCLACPLAAHP